MDPLQTQMNNRHHLHSDNADNSQHAENVVRLQLVIIYLNVMVLDNLVRTVTNLVILKKCVSQNFWIM